MMCIPLAHITENTFIKVTGYSEQSSRSCGNAVLKHYQATTL